MTNIIINEFSKLTTKTSYTAKKSTPLDHPQYIEFTKYDKDKKNEESRTNISGWTDILNLYLEALKINETSFHIQAGSDVETALVVLHD